MTNPPPAPDSPRASESPAPEGAHGELEMELVGLANSLYNLGTTVISDLVKEKDKPGGGKQVGARVNDVIHSLAKLDDLSQYLQTTLPFQVLIDVDNGRNPMQLTRERLERAASENQFMNGKINAINSYRTCYNEALVQSYPELAEFLTEPPPVDLSRPTLVPTPAHTNGISEPNGTHNGMHS